MGKQKNPETKGGLLVPRRDGSWGFRVRLPSGGRPVIPLSNGPMTEARAREAMAAMLERHTPAEIEEMFAKARAKIEAPAAPAGPTFGDVADDWTSGEIARSHPDHVSTKKTALIDEQRLARHIFPIVKDVPVTAFTLEHAQEVMRHLPAELTPATRRQVAQLVRRVLTLAVFPLRLLAHSPIPRGWMPKVQRKKQPQQEITYPDERDTFLKSAAPIGVRIIVGFLAREGMRRSEAESMEWGDVDLKRGIVQLDENKTDDPRAWDLRPDVVRALERWREMQGDPDRGNRVFPKRIKNATYRDALRAAGITRPELFEEDDKREPTAFHALRGLFVTEALANGKTETWVSDRTGHETSEMINRYRRRARTWREARLPPLGPLDELLELGAAKSSKPGSAERPMDRADGPNGFRRVESNHDSRIQSPLSCL